VGSNANGIAITLRTRRGAHALSWEVACRCSGGGWWRKISTRAGDQSGEFASGTWNRNLNIYSTGARRCGHLGDGPGRSGATLTNLECVDFSVLRHSDKLAPLIASTAGCQGRFRHVSAHELAHIVSDISTPRSLPVLRVG
jgi:hypothetical protein